MFKSLIIILLLLLKGTIIAQPCIDPSLINPDAICTAQYDPVCGCNGVTYSNSCVAVNSAGVTSWTPGECSGSPIMADPCTDLSGIDFGFCSQFLGYALFNGACTPVSGCGYVIGNVDYTLAFTTSMKDCDVNCGGLSFAEECTDVNGVDFGPCDMFMGYALVNGICTSISGCGYIVEDMDYTATFVQTLDECNTLCAEIIPSEECTDLTEVDFGACTMPLGIGIINGNCEMISGCSAVVATTDYNPSLYENMVDCEACLSSSGLSHDLLNKLKIYPNPFEAILRIEFPDVTASFCTIWDITGRELVRFSQNNKLIEFDLYKLKSGNYLLEIQFEGHKVVRSISKN
jgi:hypothetical protein